MKAGVDQQKWSAYEIVVDPAAAESIEYAFNSLDSFGTEINDMPKNRKETVTVIGYFNELPEPEVVHQEVRNALRIYGLKEDAVKSISQRQVEDADWLLEWKKHWKPTVVGRFVIAPPWEEVAEPKKIVIRIEPNMAFGTGTHETTQICLRAIEEYYRPGDSFLDVGTGTGILAIAAAKLAAGAAKHAAKRAISEASPPCGEGEATTGILACDTDADAIKIARGNAVMNGVGGIQFVDGTLPEVSPSFDLVCANLTLDVILPMLSPLLEKARKTLVLSGILAEQEGLIAEALRKLNIAGFRVDRDGEWIAVIVNPDGA